MQINEIANLKAISTSDNLWCRYRQGEQQTAWPAASGQWPVFSRRRSWKKCRSKVTVFRVCTDLTPEFLPKKKEIEKQK